MFLYVFFFFKQKTAYEMRISDWSSDVCSSDLHAMRRAGATYEEIARAGGGIASTVKRTLEASDAELLASAAMRLDALMKGGATTVAIQSGYGLDVTSELRMLRCDRALRASERVRRVPTTAALPALHSVWSDR